MDGKKRGDKRRDELVVPLLPLEVCLYFDALFIIQKWFKSFFINHKKRLLMYKELLGGSTQTKDTYRFQQRELDLVSLLY